MPKPAIKNYPELTVRQYNPKPSAISENKGPAAIEQLNALITDNYWTVLGVKRFFTCPIIRDTPQLTVSVNAFKHTLQTFGPYDSERIPHFRSGEGKTRGSVFHGHVKGRNATEYVIEWTVIDSEKKIMAIVGFGSHENYSFIEKPLTPKAKQAIYMDPDNQRILEQVVQLKESARAKSERMNRLLRNK